MRTLKIAGVIVVAIILTTLAIDASDSLSGKSGTFLAQLVGFESNVCPDGMVFVPAALTFSCVDEFEMAPDKKCLITRPENSIDTQVNISNPDCHIINADEQPPWRFIDREQASTMCTRVGKRLPNASEWYQFTLGTDESKCNINSGEASLGSGFPNCVSAAGVRNGVGNVWEWVSDDVFDGIYEGRKLPDTGYVVQADNGGVATVTTLDESNQERKDDYFWSNPNGAFAMIRGGFFSSKTDAGVYTAHAYTSPNFTGTGVGFRCVK